MIKRRITFTKILQLFLNNDSEFLSSLTNSEFYTFKPGKSNIRISITSLQNERKVDFVKTHIGLQILLTNIYAKKLERKRMPARKYYSLMGLYFFHELFHAKNQSVGNIDTITAYRKAGEAGELLVGIMDGNADREAVYWTKKLLGSRVTELQLVKLQSESLKDFPSKKGQTPLSIWRKNRRFVSSRFLWLAMDSGYWQKELSSARNYLLATWHESVEAGYADLVLTLFGENVRCLGVARLDSRERRLLDRVTYGSVDWKRKFRCLDLLLSDVIQRLHFG